MQVRLSWVLAIMALMSLGGFYACTEGDDGDTPVENCTNRLDDDRDGRTDCDDPNCASAPACLGTCGNGTCDAGETATSCPADCTTGPTCGNGTCEAGETATSCPADCATGPECGNGTCEAGETTASCPADCPAGPECGNGECEAGETATSCPADCATGPECGNGECEAGETATSCPDDCATATGSFSCLMVSQCEICCPTSDTACGEACVAAGTEAAQTQFGDFLACVSGSCSTECGSGGTEEECGTCVDENCAAERDACDAGSTGSDGCYTMMGCMNECGELPAEGSGSGDSCATDAATGCWNDCLIAADGDAFDMFVALNDCVAANCATECGPSGSTDACQRCAQSSCNTELMACVRDG